MKILRWLLAAAGITLPAVPLACARQPKSTTELTSATPATSLMRTPTVVFASRPACIVGGAIGRWIDRLSQERKNGRAGIHHHRCRGGTRLSSQPSRYVGWESCPGRRFGPYCYSNWDL